MHYKKRTGAFGKPDVLGKAGVFALLLLGSDVGAMGLMTERLTLPCEAQLPGAHQVNGAQQPAKTPTAAKNHLPDSQVAKGQLDIAWAWLGTPTRRYPHGALGSAVHAASLHVVAATALKANGPPKVLGFELPLTRVFEDRVLRLADLDGDGKDEIIVVESDAFQGSSVVVYGLRSSPTGTDTKTRQHTRLVELARSPAAGSTFRWLNPVGVADFDGDGMLDIASVTTPHIGGVLTLYHYAPPALVPFAKAMDVSNHKMGALEQRLASIVNLPGQRPTIIVPDMTLTALHALRWEDPGQWKELADVKPLPAQVERMAPLPNGACVTLVDASTWRVWLTQ